MGLPAGHDCLVRHPALLPAWTHRQHHFCAAGSLPVQVTSSFLVQACPCAMRHQSSGITQLISLSTASLPPPPCSAYLVGCEMWYGRPSTCLPACLEAVQGFPATCQPSSLLACRVILPVCLLAPALVSSAFHTIMCRSLTPSCSSHDLIWTIISGLVSICIWTVRRVLCHVRRSCAAAVHTSLRATVACRVLTQPTCPLSGPTAILTTVINLFL